MANILSQLSIFCPPERLELFIRALEAFNQVNYDSHEQDLENALWDPEDSTEVINTVDFYINKHLTALLTEMGVWPRSEHELTTRHLLALVTTTELLGDPGYLDIKPSVDNSEYSTVEIYASIMESEGDVPFIVTVENISYITVETLRKITHNDTEFEDDAFAENEHILKRFKEYAVGDRQNGLVYDWIKAHGIFPHLLSLTGELFKSKLMDLDHKSLLHEITLLVLSSSVNNDEVIDRAGELLEMLLPIDQFTKLLPALELMLEDLESL